MDNVCIIQMKLKDGRVFSFHVCVLPGTNEQLSNIMHLQEYSIYPNVFLENLPKDAYMIDIGAHIGASSFGVAKLGYKVYAFEPLESNCKALVRGSKLNQIEDKVHIYQVAIGSENSNQKIFIPKNRYDNASLDKICSNMNVRKESLLEEDIQVISIDSWYKDNNISNGLCYFFKIDVQGFEHEVLLGAKEFLKKAVKENPFIKLEFEWDPYFIKQRTITKEQIHNLLLELGFNTFEPSFELWSSTSCQNILASFNKQC